MSAFDRRSRALKSSKFGVSSEGLTGLDFCALASGCLYHED